MSRAGVPSAASYARRFGWCLKRLRPRRAGRLRDGRAQADGTAPGQSGKFRSCSKEGIPPITASFPYLFVPLLFG